MPIALRPSKNYVDPLAVLPIGGLIRAPTEGPKGIFMEVNWSSYAPGYSCHANFSQFGTDTFSQLSALSVDNSQCGADVQFIFTDTNETVTFPAYSPKTIIEVITNNREFYIQTVGTVLDGDITRFTALNFVPPPVSVSVSQEQNAAVALVIAGVGVGTTPVIAAGTNGTLEGVSIFFSGPVGSAGATQYALYDGSATPKILGGGQISYGGGNVANQPLLTLNPINLRFANGINFVQTGTNIGGAYSVNLYYRTP